MEALKRILNILSGLFVLLALLIIFDILNRTYFITTFNLVNLEGTYRALLLVAVVLLALQLLVHALHAASLKADNRRANLKINELKADLYDKRVVTKQRERDAQMAEPHAGYTMPAAPTTTPPTPPQPGTPASSGNTTGDRPYNPHV